MATILFVDDDIATLQLMQKAAEVLGHQTLVSSSPDESIELARQYCPEIILVDRHLATIDGCELVLRLHQTTDLQKIPVYLISAYLSDEDAECARLAGAVGWLEKPLSLNILTQILELAAAEAAGE
jgi:CheY-like chemotaxis protein